MRVYLYIVLTEFPSIMSYLKFDLQGGNKDSPLHL